MMLFKWQEIVVCEVHVGMDWRRLIIIAPINYVPMFSLQHSVCSFESTFMGVRRLWKRDPNSVSWTGAFLHYG